METTAERGSLRYTKIPLTNRSGVIPALGFGTLIPDPIDAKKATTVALEAGFRQFDSAERYRNEKEVGEAMQEVFKEGKIKREEVFIATKLWNNNHRPERVKPAFEASLKRLQLDYVDLYLIHTPFAFQPGDEQDPRDENGKVIYDEGVTLLDTWGALESLVDEGRCKAIGLSDVSVEKAKGIFESARIKPAVVHVARASAEAATRVCSSRLRTYSTMAKIKAVPKPCSTAAIPISSILCSVAGE
jgi:diketogulonate reductase-like aldo/keto reductase